MLHIDRKKAEELLDECVAERGEEYVYERSGDSCSYVHGIETIFDVDMEEMVSDFTNAVSGCIVGLAMKKVGVPLETMAAINDSPCHDLMEMLANTGFLTYSEGAWALFQSAQESQDYGISWGKAVELAKQNKVAHWEVDPFGEKTGKMVTSAGFGH